jgi:hypothetical protein
MPMPDDADIEDLLEQLRIFNACEHDWVTEDDGSEVCTICGGEQIPLSRSEFRRMEQLLRDSRVERRDQKRG